MSRIRGKDTKPEMIVRRFLHANGFRYRLHVKDLPGKPDIVLPKYRTVIFVHGCFWHGHEGCKYFKLPGTRTEWWREKIEMNKERDRKAHNILKNNKIIIITVYACQLTPSIKENTLNKILLKLKNSCLGL